MRIAAFRFWVLGLMLVADGYGPVNEHLNDDTKVKLRRFLRAKAITTERNYRTNHGVDVHNDRMSDKMFLEMAQTLYTALCAYVKASFYIWDSYPLEYTINARGRRILGPRCQSSGQSFRNNT